MAALIDYDSDFHPSHIAPALLCTQPLWSGTGRDDQYGARHQLEEGPHPGPRFPQTLKTLRQVEVINFGDCLVRSKGAVAIADAVHGGLPKLKVLAGWLPPPSGVQAPPRSG